MTTLTRLCWTFSALVLLAVPAIAQDGARRPEPPAGPQGFPLEGPFSRRGGPGFIQPPRIGPLPGWTQETIQRSVELGPRGTFDLSNSWGEVRLTGTEGNTVRITATKRVKDVNKDTARALLQNIVIRISERGGGVEVFTENPPGATTQILVDYEIAVPANSSVTLRSSGSVRVNNLKGELRAEAFYGHMVLTSVARIRQAKTYSGNLVVNGAEGDDIKAETAGSLQIRNVRARNVELKSITGPLFVSDVDCDRCEISSISGEIDFTGGLRRNARYLLVTTSGNIRLVPDGVVGFDLEAVTSEKASIRYDYPLKLTPASAAGGRIVRGTFGDASAIISLRSFTGNLSILKPSSGGR